MVGTDDLRQLLTATAAAGTRAILVGDAVTMAADAPAAYRTDIAAGKDALLVWDTAETADALNQCILSCSARSSPTTISHTLTHRGHVVWLCAVDRLLGACR